MATDQTPRETVAPEMTSGLTEIALVIGAVSALVTMLYGQDFGIARIGQQAAPHVLVIVLALLAGYRAIKRVSINHSNATVTKAAIVAAATNIQTVPLVPEPSDPSTDPPSMSMGDTPRARHR